MEKITRQMLADGTAKSWKATYYKAGAWYVGGGNDKKEIYDKLAALAPGSPPDLVDEIIGNGSWTDLDCNECGDSKIEWGIQVGEEADYENATAFLCEACIDKLTNMSRADK